MRYRHSGIIQIIDFLDSGKEPGDLKSILIFLR
jgi:hypothetical protein